MTTRATTPPPGPPPPTGPPPPLTPGTRTAIRAVIATGAGVLVVGLVLSLAGAAWAVSRYRMVADTLALPATLRAIAVDTGSVPVAIRITSDRQTTEPHVDIRMLSATRADSEPLALSQDGMTARVSLAPEPSPALHWGSIGEIRLVLPPDVAQELTVTTHQEMGVVFVEADVDQLVAHTAEGAIVVGGAARHIDITSAHGDVSTRGAISVSDSFRAVTDSGDISVDFASAPHTIDAETGSGDVELELPGPGPYAVNATTGQRWGSTVVRVPQTREPDDAVSVVTARSESGDVVVEALR